MQLRLTSFATYKDLVNYIKCLQKGKTSTQCYAFGDNGIGAWGDVTATTKKAMCAISPKLAKQQYGSANAAKGRLVRVTLNNVSVVCEIRDKGPDGVCDLNPAALIFLGLDQETELSETGNVEFIN